MKTFKIFAIGIIFLIASSMAHAASSSTSMMSITKKTESIISFIEDEHDMEIVRIEMDILRDSKSTTRYLSKGWTYYIVAYGDDRFKDIDVKVYRRSGDSWTLVKTDNDTSSVAMVTIEPEYTAEYKIEIIAYSFETGYDVGHYGLIIAHE